MTVGRPKLILFDIDGTLVSMRRGLPAEIFESVMREMFNLSVDLGNFDFSGKPDKLIFREIGTLAGLSEAEVASNHQSVMDAVATILENGMNAGAIQLLPGVKPLLEGLREQETTTLAILTGNTPRGARAKLEVFDLNSYFLFGVYGDEVDDRRELGPLALGRARQLIHGARFAGSDVVVIGDTLLDVACAKAIGARSIITLTGKTSREEVMTESPDFVFENLRDIERITDAIYHETEVLAH